MSESIDRSRIHRRDLLSGAASLAAVAAIAPSTAIERASRAVRAHEANDPLGVRPDFPILENGRVYLNAAYIAPSPRSVPAAGAEFLNAKASRPISVGEMLGKSGQVLGQFAKLINASPEEVGFLFATTEAENTLANSLPMRAGDNVVVDNLHYDGALVVYRELERRRGIELRIVEHRNGLVTTDDIARRVDARTRLVSLSYVSSVNGLRHDVRALADVAHAHGAHLHIDAIQAIGMFPVDVRADDVDSMCCGTYKWLLGGFGVAPFYIKKALFDRVPPDRFGIFQVDSQTADNHFVLRNTARRYNYATLPFAEVHQLGAALTYLDKVGVAKIESHTFDLTRRLEQGLLAQGHKLFTPAGNRSSVLCFYTKRRAADVRRVFEEAQIDVSVRDDHVRVAIALFNNTDDVDAALAAAKRLA